MGLERRVDAFFSDRVYIRIAKNDHGTYVWREISNDRAWFAQAGIAIDSEVFPYVSHEDRQKISQAFDRVLSGTQSSLRTSVRFYGEAASPIAAHLGVTREAGNLIGYLESADLDEPFEPRYRLGEILEQASVSYILLDADYIILDFNDRADRYARSVLRRPMTRGMM
jgi:hypothetical protein